MLNMQQKQYISRSNYNQSIFVHNSHAVMYSYLVLYTSLHIHVSDVICICTNTMPCTLCVCVWVCFEAH